MANSKKASNKKASRREVADKLRNQQKRADKRQGAVIVGVCVLVALVIVGLAAYKPIKEWWDMRDYQDVPLDEIGASADVCAKPITKKAKGNQKHVPEGTEVDYGDDQPPAFGRHENVPDTMERKLYTEEDRPRLEKLVHNLEHGYTLVWYDDTIREDSQQWAQLKAIAEKLKGTGNQRLRFKAVPWTEEDGKPFPDGKHLVFTHWSIGGKDATLADGKQVGVWQYCSEVSGEALDAFMLKYPYMDSPEPLGM